MSHFAIAGWVPRSFRRRPSWSTYGRPSSRRSCRRRRGGYPCIQSRYDSRHNRYWAPLTHIWSSGSSGTRNPSQKCRYRVRFSPDGLWNYQRPRTAPWRCHFLTDWRWPRYQVGRVRGTPARSGWNRNRSRHGRPRYFHILGNRWRHHHS